MMKPFGLVSLLLSSTILALPGVVRGQDTIRYLDPKTMKEATATGTIQEETPAHVSYKPSTASSNREIASPDIIDVVYDMPPSVKLTYRSALTEDKKATDLATKDTDRPKSLADAIKSLQEVQPKLAGEKYKFVQRHVQFKIARLLARAADYDPSQSGAALAALQAFKKQHGDTWQITLCCKLLARLQLTKGDAEGARLTYEELAATANLPGPVRQECELLAANALLEGKKYAEAEKKLHALASAIAPDDPRAPKLRIALVRCQGSSGKLQEAVKQLEGVIADTSDKSIKAAAYNALGDCYRAQGRGKDALWQYLWVDVIYHQDREEHLKAMEHLAKLFEEQGDKGRAKEYRDKVARESW